MHAVLHGNLGASLGSHLSSERGGLTGALETNRSGRLPGNDITLGVGDGNDRVVERGADVRLSNRDVLTIRALDAGAANVLLSSSHDASVSLISSSWHRSDASDPYGYER